MAEGPRRRAAPLVLRASSPSLSAIMEIIKKWARLCACARARRRALRTLRVRGRPTPQAPALRPRPLGLHRPARRVKASSLAAAGGVHLLGPLPRDPPRVDHDRQDALHLGLHRPEGRLLSVRWTGPAYCSRRVSPDARGRLRVGGGAKVLAVALDAGGGGRARRLRVLRRRRRRRENRSP